MVKYEDVIFEIEPYEKFEDFYNDFLHYKGKHRSIIKESIFRGHSSENFELIPRVLREKDEKIKMLDIFNNLKTDKNIQHHFESRLLTEFRKKANFNSLNIPPLKRKEQEDYWNFENFETIAALAQHNGLPTRLLDWTREIDTALYFAAAGNVDKQVYKNGSYIVIWVLDWWSFYALNDYVDNKKNPLDNLLPITPDYYSNPNLGAQKGLFTFWKDITDSNTVDTRPLDQLVFEEYKSMKVELEAPLNIMTKLMIHKKKLGTIYKYLGNKNWKAAKLFPGFGGVIKEMEEDSYFEKFFY